MLKLSMLITAALVGTIVCGTTALAQAPAGAGHWEGSISMPNGPTGFSVDLDRNRAGAWIGTMTIVGTTAVDVPLNAITIGDKAITFTVNLPGRTSFEGTVSADAQTVSGMASNEQGGVPFQLTRKGDAKVNAPPPSTPLVKAFEGTWQGTIQSAGQTLRIVLKVGASADGTATATVINLDQGAQELPATTVAITGNQIFIEARGVSGTYRGTLGATGEIVGEWAQGPAHVPLNFHR